MRYRKEPKRKKLSSTGILILCEGKTEKIYLEGLRKSLPRRMQHDIDLDIKQTEHSETITALKEIDFKLKKAKSEKQPYTESWLIFDDDKRELRDVFLQLKKKGIKHVYNSISVEFWFLLHYKNTTRQFENADAVISELKKDFGAFRKTDLEFWNKLKTNYATAKANALKLRNKHKTEGNILPLCKPYTNMDELVDRIKSFNQ